MPNQPANSRRLIQLDPLTHHQNRVLQELHDSDGTCTCGRVLTRLSPKFVLCNAILKSPTGKLDGALILAVYCLSCFNLINQTMKSLRGSFVPPADPHRDISPLANP